MPKSELILSKLGELYVYDEYERPYVDRGISDRRSRFWEANEQGGHFQIFKFKAEHMQYTPKEYAIDAYKLTISGAPQSKERIIADFKKALGEPRLIRENSKKKTVMTVVWEIGPKIPRWGQKH